jgi:hypothetical protein
MQSLDINEVISGYAKATKTPCGIVWLVLHASRDGKTVALNDLDVGQNAMLNQDRFIVLKFSCNAELDRWMGVCNFAVVKRGWYDDGTEYDEDD